MTLMTTQAHDDDGAERQVNENIVTMLFRLGQKQQDAAIAVGMTPATFSRRLSGQQPWLLREVRALAARFDVSLTELTTDLPSFSEWEARVGERAWRDSNPQPSDLYPARHLYVVPPVQPTLTLVGRAS